MTSKVIDLQPDAVSDAAVVILYEHHEIHEGDAFLAHHSAGSKGDGDMINIYLKTPNTTKRLHMFAKWASSGAGYFRILEAPTVTANTGTNAVVAVNRERNSATTSTIVDNATTPAANKYGKDVTVTGNGTVLVEEFSGTAKTSAAEGRSDNEFILKANTAYVFQVESDAAGLTLWLNLNWYEHVRVNA